MRDANISFEVERDGDDVNERLFAAAVMVGAAVVAVAVVLGGALLWVLVR